VSIKTAVIVLLAIVVVVVLLIFFGAVRPSSGPPDAGRGGVKGALGWLRSQDAVTFEELASTRPGCEDLETRTFAVASGSTCRIALPDNSSFTLCASENAGSALATVEGAEFPAGTLESDDLTCVDPAELNVYDKNTVLSLTCAPFGALCRFSVGEPSG